ncbi:uncharacterized protein LOC114749653 [Neltuma alba]|uniref:uncharacterized protein LOC114716986 n=1 Tax=Neltuma alba TaxID=207710 RepID=UPI0010A3CCFA|nr:uncharacterized protein LOC114716986 [Prosopis alba]XP_028757902.1 uncharacterized protein LOC114716989 [Prosopis alba]XP_028794026.1 uncharacterized protein LOC114749653 [Prosopis alba]
MAIDLCSEISSAGISPRISFSHDLKNTKDDDDDPLEDHRRRRSDLCLLDSSSDFVFCISNHVLSQELSSADELFSNGKIVPMEIKKPKSPNASSSSCYSEIHPFSESGVCPRSETSSTGCTEKKKRLVEFLNEEEKPPSRSFWQFKRSSSLNCEATRGKSLIRSLQFLSRSKSTGSSLNPKQSEIPKETQKQRLQKQSSVSSRRPSSSSSSSSSAFYFYSSSRNPPSLNKKCGSSGNGVRISPVLNLPQAYIPKAYVGFFGFGSLFCNGKIKRKNK